MGNTEVWNKGLRMRIISHRGNLDGPNPSYENHPEYINGAISNGFKVEVDLWETVGDATGAFYLGHDEPIHKLFEFSYDHIYHCKDLRTFLYMDSLGIYPKFEFFYHTEEAIVHTSYNWRWIHPNFLRVASLVKRPEKLNKSIAVLPEQTDLTNEELMRFGGICTDYPLQYKEVIDYLEEKEKYK